MLDGEAYNEISERTRKIAKDFDYVVLAEKLVKVLS
jgi:hypothetical protein